jgi:hypothetical protein
MPIRIKYNGFMTAAPFFFIWGNSYTSRIDQENPGTSRFEKGRGARDP